MSSIRFIFGFHAILSRLRQNPDSIKDIFLDSARRDQRARDLVKSFLIRLAGTSERATW